MDSLLEEFKKYWAFKPVRTMFWVRMLSYLTIFISPFWGMLVAIYFDAWDWDYLQKYHMEKSWYHRIDKVVDYIEYLVIIPLVLSSPIASIYIFFLIWRTIGMILYFVYGLKDSIFVFFPNVAEYIAIAYFMSLTFSLGWDIASWQWIAGILLFKLLQELQLHFFQIALPIADKPQPKIALLFAKFNQSIIK